MEIDFRGEPKAEGYYSKNPDAAGWRYGLVAVDDSGFSHYSDMMSDSKGKIKYKLPVDCNISNLYFVVMGAPTRHWQNIDGEDNPGDAQWPYSFSIKGTEILK